MVSVNEVTPESVRSNSLKDRDWPVAQHGAFLGRKTSREFQTSQTGRVDIFNFNTLWQIIHYVCMERILSFKTV